MALTTIGGTTVAAQCGSRDATMSAWGQRQASKCPRWPSAQPSEADRVGLRASQSRGPRADVALAYLLRVLTAGRPVKFELTESTRQVIDDYLRVAGRRSGEYLFTGRRLSGHMTTRQYARLLSRWLADIGLDPHLFGTHSLRRTKATLIYRRTGNLRAVQLLPGILRSRAPFDISASRSTMPSR